jgi:RHS repeat-associated protein
MTGTLFTYGYDSTGRLATAVIPGHSYVYGYAASGGCGASPAAGKNTNRTSWSDGATVLASYCYDNADRLTSTSQAGYTTAPMYDTHGNTVSLAGQTLTYDPADRHMSTTSATVQVSYSRDALDRIVARLVGGLVQNRYSYAGTSDAASATLSPTNVLTELTLGLPGGVMLTTRATGNVWSYPNLHGNVIATANQAGTKTGGPFLTDPFGNSLSGGLPDNSAGNLDNAWLGQHQRPTEHEAGIEVLIEMGARGYSPLVGRFLEVDPVESGATYSDYAYVADPVNQADVSGLWCLKIIEHLPLIGKKRDAHPKECAGAKGATALLTFVGSTIVGIAATVEIANLAGVCVVGAPEYSPGCIAAATAGSAYAAKVGPPAARLVGSTSWNAGRAVARCLFLDDSEWHHCLAANDKPNQWDGAYVEADIQMNLILGFGEW